MDRHVYTKRICCTCFLFKDRVRVGIHSKISHLEMPDSDSQRPQLAGAPWVVRECSIGSDSPQMDTLSTLGHCPVLHIQTGLGSLVDELRVVEKRSTWRGQSKGRQQICPSCPGDQGGCVGRWCVHCGCCRAYAHGQSSTLWFIDSLNK